jgi:hypothetical protein
VTPKQPLTGTRFHAHKILNYTTKKHGLVIVPVMGARTRI